jgi:hypothetical protein
MKRTWNGCLKNQWVSRVVRPWSRTSGAESRARTWICDQNLSSDNFSGFLVFVNSVELNHPDITSEVTSVPPRPAERNERRQHPRRPAYLTPAFRQFIHPQWACPAIGSSPRRSFVLTTIVPAWDGPNGDHPMLTVDTAESRFVSLLPVIELHARFAFRGVRCLFTRDDRIADAVALAWKCFVRLAEKGKDVEGFKTTFASTVARSVSCGRRVTRMEKAKDVMSRRAQTRKGFTVDSIDEPLRANTITPVPDQAAFRIDFRAWVKTLTSRERRIVRAMLRDERTLDLSRQFNLSPGRISQMRREFAERWMRYCG